MKELTIVFTKSKKKFPIASWLIRLWTGKPYSHCARCFTVYEDITMYYQSSEGKINYENEKAFSKKHEIVKLYTIEVTEEMYVNISKACLKDAGVEYGVMQNIGIALVDICALFGKKIDNPWKRGKNCSEALYVNVFKPMFPDLDYNPDTIKPHYIERIIVERINNYL